MRIPLGKNRERAIARAEEWNAMPAEALSEICSNKHSKMKLETKLLPPRRIERGRYTATGEPLFGLPHIYAESMPYEKISAVYFLFEGTSLLYVGSSLDVQKRVFVDHRLRGVHFDRYAWIACDPKILRKLEGAYITALQPKLNVLGVRNRESFERFKTRQKRAA